MDTWAPRVLSVQGRPNQRPVNRSHRSMLYYVLYYVFVLAILSLHVLVPHLEERGLAAQVWNQVVQNEPFHRQVRLGVAAPAVVAHVLEKSKPDEALHKGPPADGHSLGLRRHLLALLHLLRSGVGKKKIKKKYYLPGSK
eukprot:1195562-Prorocentrum_minimum.AAC.4